MPSGDRPSECSEEQLIWVYCDTQRDVDDVVACCKTSQRPKRNAILDLSGRDHDWNPRVQQGLPGPLHPYSACEQEEFWADASALLAASQAAVAAVGKSSGARWPPLFVTNHEKLYQASAEGSLRSMLAQLARMRDSAVLTVVLAADFGILCGLVVKGSALDKCTPLSLSAEPGKSMPVRPQVDNPSTPSDVTGPAARAVALSFGIYMQRPRLADVGSSEQVVAGDSVGKNILFGARCFGMLRDGRCAYCAVSPDGARSVEAFGRWKLVNGHVLLVGSADECARVSHFQFGEGGTILLHDVVYDEPISISVEELEADFESPVSLAACAPTGGQLLKLQILEESPEGDGGEVSPRPQIVQGVEHTEASALTAALDATFHAAWQTALPSELAEASAAARPTEARAEAVQGNAYPDRTQVHALISLANLEAQGRVGLAEPPPQDVGEAGPAPRLLGLQRGVTNCLATAAQEVAERNSASRNGYDMLSSLQALLKDANLNAEEMESKQQVRTCPVRPGIYKTEGRPSRENVTAQKFELLLHVDGSCVYNESFCGSSLCSMQGAVTWSCESGMLMLQPSRPGVHGFLLREARGSRSVERRVGQVEIPIAFVRDSCSYSPFTQSVEPFPGHSPLRASLRVFGVIDPKSPVLRGLRCRPDKLPCHAFQHELRRQGLPVDEILSDFRFVDRDADGQVSVADVRRIATFGMPVAAPEVLEELREALVKCWGGLPSAFEALSASASAGRVSTCDFERFCSLQIADSDVSYGPAPPAPRGRVQSTRSAADVANARAEALKEWIKKTTPEDRAAVFASLDPEGNAAIDLTDFLSLSLHTAVLSARRLQHFQSWLCEMFDHTADVFKKIFKALGPSDENVLTRKRFQEGAKSIGYPCDTRAARGMHLLLDRNADGEITMRDFLKLREFSVENLFRDLETLKCFVDTHLGGVDASFEKFAIRERALRELPALPKVVSFESITKTCGHLGFSKAHAKADLKMVFLFLKEASGGKCSDQINSVEWSLLKSFNSKAITGSPARLRRIILERYGSIDNAFERMHTSWLKRALAKGLMQTALGGLVHSLAASMCSQTSNKAGPISTRDRGTSARPGASPRPPLPCITSKHPDEVTTHADGAPERHRSFTRQKRPSRSASRQPSAHSADVPPLPPALVPPPPSSAAPSSSSLRGSHSRPRSATSSSPALALQPRHQRPPALLPRPMVPAGSPNRRN